MIFGSYSPTGPRGAASLHCLLAENQRYTSMLD